MAYRALAKIRGAALPGLHRHRGPGALLSGVGRGSERSVERLAGGEPAPQRLYGRHQRVNHRLVARRGGTELNHSVYRRLKGVGELLAVEALDITQAAARAPERDTP